MPHCHAGDPRLTGVGIGFAIDAADRIENEGTDGPRIDASAILAKERARAVTVFPARGA